MDTIDFFSEKSLTEKLPSYNAATDDISAVLDMRGLPVTLDMTGNKIVFNVNSLGISETLRVLQGMKVLIYLKNGLRKMVLQHLKE